MTVNSNFRNSIKIIEEYSEYWKAFFNMVEPLKRISHGHLKNINPTSHRIEVASLIFNSLISVFSVQ